MCLGSLGTLPAEDSAHPLLLSCTCSRIPWTINVLRRLLVASSSICL
ncbi:hypothetical protein SFRURICE_009017 [Spodoptera frugiperda]|nr:hypothetical protein SFRURICE_009017 [Spodoptera frugiperda]